MLYIHFCIYIYVFSIDYWLCFFHSIYLFETCLNWTSIHIVFRIDRCIVGTFLMYVLLTACYFWLVYNHQLCISSLMLFRLLSYIVYMCYIIIYITSYIVYIIIYITSYIVYMCYIIIYITSYIDIGRIVVYYCLYYITSYIDIGRIVDYYCLNCFLS